jgi:tRNA (cmo5U34)-methyltransferase
MKIPQEWSFKTEEVAANFDDHVREQLPWYDLMARAVALTAKHYIPERGRVYDLGCSTGNIGNLLRETLQSRHCEFLPVDNSEAMRAQYRGPGSFELADFATMTFKPFDVALSFLALMFLCPKERAVTLARLREAANPGGAIVLVDKFENAGGYFGTILSRLTMDGKLSMGANPGQVVEKEISLIGIQRPMRLEEVPDGKEIFRFGEFAGFLIET